ncbi:superfamily II DNA or RNA helicase/HKD family nuclease [Salibacterium salarium]|uniref:DUF3427 domain-containing protein n=1 Tax=Salibacterium salarium TaxID=284579 RepID=UPI002786F997|nr:DEAD/DEAH box helicase [Salibacterium salarium]MDQ0300619.1 superfamily II DNA or RNA helicase/HKD family nuclease [Salibacterium salarium]
MGNFISKLEASLHKGFIDQSYPYQGDHQPQLLLNKKEKSEDVLSSITEELDHCQSFIFSVAFITESGLASLKSHLFDLREKGIHGRILTSTFLNFNQPKVFRELLKLKNVEVRLTNVEGFHSKGYIFEKDTHYSLIVGSSNLTSHAMKVNYEWNVKLTSYENGEIIYHFKNQFDDVWKDAICLTSEWVLEYEKKYNELVEQKPVNQIADFPSDYVKNPVEESMQIEPNKMQEAALRDIEAVREDGKEKGLIISATGTGKTYLSVFDVRRFAPKRMLFIVHREQILQKAINDFQRVLGGADKDFGILSGSNKDKGAKYLFATIQTISKEKNLQEFDPTEFDYIVIDEVHKAGANSYHKVIEYFTPTFMLGMTATPERTDDFNIYELFDYNIAYEIRLQEALEEDMLCPFHYFGVTDFEYNGSIVDDATELANLVTEERVNHLLNKIHYYGYSGERVRGLIFCSRKEEAHHLSKVMNEKNFNTVALTGDDSQELRLQRINELENGKLDYILTVDIFNEGVDIPSINQVVMLRQTQSSIIFIQQLGRGLRKNETKDYVTVIDFIGNYKNNYLIPVALSGDKSQNKDNIRRRMKDTSYIKGVSTIHFEEIAKKQIFKSIDTTNLTTMKILKDAYKNLKNRLGRVPYLYDFIQNHSIDPVVLVGKSNYYQFLKKMKQQTCEINEYENNILTMLSQEVLNGKRKHEVVLLKMLLQQEKVSREHFIHSLRNKGCRTDDATIASVENIFDLSFFTQNNKKKYGNIPMVTLNHDLTYEFNNDIEISLRENPYYKKLMKDIVDTAEAKSEKYPCDTPFQLYDKYTRKDVVKLLNWKQDESSTVYGYKTKHQTCPIFVTYHKDDTVETSVDYGDEFISQDVLKWYTRSNRTLQSNEVQKIIHAKENNINIHLFVKKDDDEGSDFYYLGKAVPEKDSVEETRMKGKDDKNLPVVKMNMRMEQKMDNKLYHYIKQHA